MREILIKNTLAVHFHSISEESPRIALTTRKSAPLLALMAARCMLECAPQWADKKCGKNALSMVKLLYNRYKSIIHHSGFLSFYF